MTGEQVDYAAILNDMETKKAALEAAIASLRAALSLGALGQGGELAPLANGTGTTFFTPGPMGGDLPAGFSLGKSIPEAARLYLSIVKQKQTSAEIAEALKKGGMESTSKNFQQIVHSVLDRARKAHNAEIIKLGRSHWGLAAWYPAGLRAGSAAPAKKGKKKSKKAAGVSASSAAPKATAAAPPPSVATTTTPKPVPAKPEEQVLRLLTLDPKVEFTAKQIAEEIGIKVQTACLILGKLGSRSKVVKTDAGKYHAVAGRVASMAG